MNAATNRYRHQAPRPQNPLLENMHICFAGNMLGRNSGYITTQGQVLADLFAADGLQVTCVSSRINRFARLFEIVTTLIGKGRKFDALVVEVYSGMGFVVADVASWLGKLLDVPVIMVLHGGHLDDFIEHRPRWTKRVLKRADSLVAPSAFLAKKIGARGYLVLQIPNVLDLGSYPFRERSLIRPRLIWMRSFHPIYNPDMAVQVLARLRVSYPNATLTMAGVDKGAEDKIKRMAREAGLRNAVRFPGFLNADEKVREFADADIYLNTNRIDNMPVSVLEACAFGLPIVATKVGGLPYLIDDGENGLLVPDEDAPAMAAAVTKLLNDPELTRRISNGARRLAERSSWEIVRQKWEELFAITAAPRRVSERNKEGNLSTENAKA